MRRVAAKRRRPMMTETRKRVPGLVVMALLGWIGAAAGCGEQVDPDDDDSNPTGDDDTSPAGDDDTGCIEDDDLYDDDATADDDDATADDDDSSGDDDDTVVPTCPAGMANIDGLFCMDVFEASRPDATASSYGSDTSMAISQVAVLPWPVTSNAEADQACQGAGKRLCAADEWTVACMGPAVTAYPYGDTYEPQTCNGIDTFCTCEDGSFYEDCYWDCGADYHPTTTGELPGCTNGFGVYDISGNLWEHVQGGDSTTVRGGAYNCAHSDDWHRCDYIPGWTPSALGFRCCRDI
jgi:formylglycine-generating enzyme